MSSEDAFSSIQWDRDDKHETHQPTQNAIIEESSPSALLLLEPPVETSSTNLQPEPENQPETGNENVVSSAVEHIVEAEQTVDAVQPSKSTEPGLTEQRQMEDRMLEEQFRKYPIRVHVSQPISDRDGNSKSYISYLITTTTSHPDILKLLPETKQEGKDGENTNESGNAESEGAGKSADTESEGGAVHDGESAENEESPVSEHTSTQLGSTLDRTIKVRRRYGDFRFLHECLASDFPQVLVPPLPPKLNFKHLTGDTFSTLFVHKRLHLLDRFLQFISCHRDLSQLAVFHYFVSESGEWATFTKNLKIAKGDDQDLLVGKVVNEDLLTERVMNFFTSSKHKRETNKDILEISDKLKKLYENLLRLDRIFSKLNRKNSDLKADYEQFLVQIDRLAAVQSATAAANDTGLVDASPLISSDAQSAVNNFKTFSESLLYFLDRWGDLHRYIDESFLVTLKDCAKYIVRFTDLIELQHNKKIDLQVLEDYLAKARTDLSAMGGTPHAAPPTPVLIGQANTGIVNSTTQLIKDTLSTSATPHIGSSHTDSKKVKLQQRILQLEYEIRKQTELVSDLTARIINDEYPNWERFNKQQLKQSMVGLCDQEISFYRGLVDNWSDVELKLMKRIDELS